jgi:hypothetical protein
MPSYFELCIDDCCRRLPEHAPVVQELWRAFIETQSERFSADKFALIVDEVARAGASFYSIESQFAFPLPFICE